MTNDDGDAQRFPGIPGDTTTTHDDGDDGEECHEV
jgi:hypothetical protein